jgi:plastocyanin
MKLLITSISIFFLSSFSLSYGQDFDICPGADVEIETISFMYTPDALMVEVGTTVGWVNAGGNHDVMGITNSITDEPFNNPEPFSIGSMLGSPSGVCLGTFTFTVPGVYNYDCSIGSHAANGMVASITVSAPVFGCTNADACNYDQTATEDDESCLFVGDACDDGSADTESDVIQDDCSCEGSIISSIDNFEALSVLMFPNPATSELNITLNKKSTLKVFDAIGKMVQETGSVLTWALDVSDWEKGLYTLQTQAGKTYKFIVE